MTLESRSADLPSQTAELGWPAAERRWTPSGSLGSSSIVGGRTLRSPPWGAHMVVTCSGALAASFCSSFGGEPELIRIRRVVRHWVKVVASVGSPPPGYWGECVRLPQRRGPIPLVFALLAEAGARYARPYAGAPLAREGQLCGAPWA